MMPSRVFLSAVNSPVRLTAGAEVATKVQPPISGCFIFFTWVALIMFFSVLLWNKKIQSAAFTVLFIATSAFAIALLGFDRLKSVKGQGFEVALHEMEGIRTDVYAKAETVKRLAEASAEIAVENVRLSRPLTMDEMGREQMSEEEMLKSRDRILSTLKQANSNSAIVERVASEVNAVVLESLKKKLHWQVMGLPGADQEVVNRSREIIFNAYDRQALLNYLRDKNVPTDKLTPALERIDLFLRTGRL
jgi:hypothetical protein